MKIFICPNCGRHRREKDTYQCPKCSVTFQAQEKTVLDDSNEEVDGISWNIVGIFISLGVVFCMFGFLLMYAFEDNREATYVGPGVDPRGFFVIFPLMFILPGIGFLAIGSFSFAMCIEELFTKYIDILERWGSLISLLFGVFLSYCLWNYVAYLRPTSDASLLNQFHYSLMIVLEFILVFLAISNAFFSLGHLSSSDTTVDQVSKIDQKNS